VASPGGPQISYGDGYARFSAKPVTMGNITATMSMAGHKYLPAIADLASRVGSTIQTPPELPEVQGNGQRAPGSPGAQSSRTRAGAGNQPYTPVW
jgi:hypothetical protein